MKVSAMKMRGGFASCLSLLISFTDAQQVPIIHTTSGLLRGFTAFSDVQAYLGIPYAQPPIGDLRFSPPQPFQGNNASVKNCFTSTAGCFQQQYITAFSDRSTGISESEDMLSINIWKPTNTNSTKSLPVMIFLYGGGFSSGANAMPQYDGSQFVAEQKDIIVATINYRVNIFGFPNSPAIPYKNVGLLDQRLAVEWLRDNIASFGGDPRRMVLSGQSAGSISATYWSYTYPNDPIVSGLIEYSGQPGLLATDDGSSWIAIANSTGCSNDDKKVELACMKKVPARTLKHAMSVNNMPGFTDVVYGGNPVVDNVTVLPLEEYAARLKAGKFSKVPLLISNTLSEADGVLPFSPLTGVNTTLSDLFTTYSFHCPVSTAAFYHSQHLSPLSISTYRYLYSGSFSETMPYDWMRPYHGADIMLVFKMERRAAWDEVGEEVLRAGVYIRNAVAAFVRDPGEGLRGFGWPKYSVGAPTLVKLFGNNSAAVTFEDPAVYDSICPSIN
ncbi:Alpha/Beta hydrolase protein [Tricladium varicosporioides]|nr:Alpha/Beta hydrolase protein [Hymenoscyphus varicosporioides]